MSKQRLDVLLVERNLSTSRQKAQVLIRAGEVMVNQQIIDKPGTEVDLEADIKVKQKSLYVSRGGYKLAKALEYFSIPISDRICLDGGISTGGFTDCLLQAGAKLIYGIDVGYGQVDWKLRNDSRVILKERTNIRYLTPEKLYGDSLIFNYESQENATQIYPSLAVVDVSFISITKILSALWQLLIPPRETILLVKPQFEVGKEKVGKKGVVRSSFDQAEAIFQVCCSANNLGWKLAGLTWSPIQGPAGNIEYLLWLNLDSDILVDKSAIAQITKLAQQAFKHNSSLIDN
ncbi:TlyA family RNA methyltransferase [Okeania sp.]|uniref:TlyA family RNA methyltransferase n=1 Tax=Okeania sp. TaxID=3100323 RepID=UPI002B4AF963|nr:TlyA family RNA methyltransferase [Okeania sp.]MEB3341969.1 TlyA family RNA methyltransferase [Okeania sp.]